MKSFNKTLLVTFVAAGLVACSSEQPNVASTEVSKSAKAPFKRSIGKTGAPIDMQYKILNAKPQVGQEIEIEVSFNTPLKSSVNSQFHAPEKLIWVSSAKSFESSVNKASQRSTIPNIKVVAEKEGVFYVHLVASVMHDGKRLAKPFTIPVRVGNGAFELEKPGEVKVDEKGQTIIVQKAETNQ